MARVIDENKLTRIYEAAIYQVVEEGYGGASISSIARKADVAVGYLYRFYPGKRELINHLLDTSINEIANELELMLNRVISVNEIVVLLVDYFFDMAKHRPHHVKFIYQMLSQSRFFLSEERRNNIRELSRRVLQLGQQSGAIGRDYGYDEVFILMVMVPMEYINLNLKGFFEVRPLISDDRARVVHLVSAALKGGSV